jgi:hypothetical protein
MGFGHLTICQEAQLEFCRALVAPSLAFRPAKRLNLFKPRQVG